MVTAAQKLGIARGRDPTPLERVLRQTLASTADRRRAAIARGGVPTSIGPVRPPTVTTSPIITEKAPPPRALTPANVIALRGRDIGDVRRKSGIKPKDTPAQQLRKINQFLRKERQELTATQRQVTTTAPKDKRELPFEKAIRLIPETAGKAAKAAVGITPLGKAKVTVPAFEVPLKQTVSRDTTGKVIFPGREGQFSE